MHFVIVRFGSKYLDEQLFNKDYVGIAVIILGLTFSVIVGPKGVSQDLNAQDLQRIFQDNDFLIFLGVYSVITLMDWMLITMKKIENETLCMLSFVFIASYFSSWNLLAVKSIAEILSSSFGDAEAAKLNLSHWLSFVLVLVWTVSVLSLEYWKQKALNVFVSTYVMVVYRVFSIIAGVIFGAFSFDDFDESTNVQIVLYVLSVFIAILGVFIVAFKVDGKEMKNMLHDLTSNVAPKSKTKTYPKYDSL